MEICKVEESRGNCQVVMATQALPIKMIMPIEKFPKKRKKKRDITPKWWPPKQLDLLFQLTRKKTNLSCTGHAENLKLCNRQEKHTHAPLEKPHIDNDNNGQLYYFGLLDRCGKETYIYTNADITVN